MIRTYQIPENLQHKYHGCGYGVAAIKDNRIADFVYLEDEFPNFNQTTPLAFFDAIQAGHFQSLADRLGPQGEPVVGMISTLEFIVIHGET